VKNPKKPIACGELGSAHLGYIVSILTIVSLNVDIVFWCRYIITYVLLIGEIVNDVHFGKVLYACKCAYCAILWILNQWVVCLKKNVHKNGGSIS
jgi:hypothetical protein